VRVASRNPDVKPKWLVVSHLDDQYHLWRDTHKEISHNFSQVEKLERRVREIEGRMEGLDIKDENVEDEVEGYGRFRARIKRVRRPNDSNHRWSRTQTGYSSEARHCLRTLRI
jgi:hypothetical protein